MNHTFIINYFIKKYNYTSYLEIGTCDIIHNFIHIDCIHKECIDPSPINTTGVTYLMTSDEAFGKIQSQNKKYDLIFIDGLHLEGQVDNDIENSLACLTTNGTIILHDCNPPTAIHGGDSYQLANIYTNNDWNGTVYKSIVKFNQKNTCGCVVDIDWGCGIIRPSLQNRPIVINHKALIMDWDNFDKNRKNLLKLVPETELFNM